MANQDDDALVDGQTLGIMIADRETYCHMTTAEIYWNKCSSSRQALPPHITHFVKQARLKSADRNQQTDEETSPS